MGSSAGLLLATALMVPFLGEFREVFWVVLVPAALAVVLLLFGVNEPERRTTIHPANPIRRAALRWLGAAYCSSP